MALLCGSIGLPALAKSAAGAPVPVVAKEQPAKQIPVERRTTPHKKPAAAEKIDLAKATEEAADPHDKLVGKAALGLGKLQKGGPLLKGELGEGVLDAKALEGMDELDPLQIEELRKLQEREPERIVEAKELDEKHPPPPERKRDAPQDSKTDVKPEPTKPKATTPPPPPKPVTPPEELPAPPPPPPEPVPPPPPQPVAETPPAEAEAPAPPPVDPINPEWQEYVRTPGRVTNADAGDPNRISGRNADDDHLARVPVTADQEGPASRAVQGFKGNRGGREARPMVPQFSEDAPQQPVTETKKPLHEQGAAAKPVPVPTDHDAQPPPQVAGGGSNGVATGSGAPTPGERAKEGGPATPQGDRANGGRPVEGRAAMASAGQQGYDAAPTGNYAAAVEAPSWWRPAVARVVIRPGTPSPVPNTGVREVRPQIQPGRAPEPKPGKERDRGGNERIADATSPPPEHKGPADGPSVEQKEAPAPIVDIVEDFRKSMGWGEIDRSRLSPKPSDAGRPGRNGSPASSPQSVMTDAVRIEPKVYLSATGTPEGAYRERLDALVQAAWLTSDLPVHERALGVQGDVTVVFRVNRVGKVSDVKVTRSSGNPALDDLARNAIPLRLPRFPRDIDRAFLWHQYNFRYRNDVIGSVRPPRSTP